MQRRVKQFVLASLASMTLLMPWACPALPIDLSGADDAVGRVIESTASYRRVRSLETPLGAEFWIRRLSRESELALQSIGRYEAEVTASLSPESGGILVRVEPGRETRVTVVQLTHGAEFDEPPLAFPLKVGDILEHERYDAGVRATHAWFLEHGYLNFELKNRQIKVNRSAATAEIILDWDAGPRHRFSDVRFSGSPFRDEFMQRYVPFDRGDHFSEASLQELSNRLRHSNYFRTVTITPVMDAIDGVEVPIQVLVEPMDRILYQLGMSFGSDLGLGLELETKRRWINDRGHLVQGEARIATDQKLIAGRYEIPSARNHERSFFVDTSITDEDTESSQRTTARFGINRLSRLGQWRRVDAVNLLHEDFKVGGNDTSSHFLLPGITFSQVTADDPVRPNRGWRASLELSAASGDLGSSTSLVRAEARYKRLGPIGQRSRWIARGRLGAMWTDDFSQVPTSQRFLAGGVQSIRGFDYEELGPRNENGEVIGGEFVAEGSLEVDRRIRDEWGVAAFVDFGNAFGNGPESIEYGGGVGLRWFSPIGPLRLDVGAALSRSGNPITIHISAGPDL